MAHLQGTDYVGSMVVLEDGLPNKREYRRFKVNVPGNDDYAAMREVLTRRLQAYLAARRETPQPGQRPAKFSYPPQLLLVDGGKGQLGVAEQVVDELGLADEIPVAGLAKRFEQVFVPGRSTPVDIPRGSEALFMLQRIRDEAHRFANTFHAERRSKRMTRSALDGIPGLGETRAQAPAQGARRRQRREAGVARAAAGAALAPEQRGRGGARALPPARRRLATTSSIRGDRSWPRRRDRALTCGGGDDEAAPATPLTSAELWEQHSQWWIDGFTGGADPEYDEQILPLAAAELTARDERPRRRVRRGPDQPPGARGSTASSSSSASIRRGTRSASPPNARRCRLRQGGRPRAAVR